MTRHVIGPDVAMRLAYERAALSISTRSSRSGVFGQAFGGQVICRLVGS